MNTTRRHFLGLGAAGLAGALLSGCETVEQRLTKPALPPDAILPRDLSVQGIAPELRLLQRTAYGPRPGDLARIKKLGMAAYVDEQLHPESIAEEPVLTWRVGALGDILNADSGLLFDVDDHQVVSALRQATLLRAVYSRKQLYERVVEFWTDHFNIYVFKGEGAQLKVANDKSAVRAHALGKFRTLLGATARSAAMLGYLDNGANQKGIPNENYARELMELHTLGVRSGYTQRDVQEVARCFTGWTTERHWHRGRFLFDSSRHDDGPKQVLGLFIPAGGGITDGERVLDLLAAHPATANHLARKLCVHFMGTSPAILVRAVAQTFQATGGDISAVVRQILLSSDMTTAPSVLKRPLDYMTSALRAFNADTDCGPALQAHMEKMGQPLFAWPMPDGYPEKESAWIGSLIPRWKFALAMADGKIDNTKIDWTTLASAGRAHGLSTAETLAELAFGSPAANDFDHLAINRAGPPQFSAALLMSPQFQWR